MRGGWHLRPVVPQNWDDVTPAWMEQAIARDHPDAKIAKVEIVTRDDGTNRRARFALSYASGRGPKRVFIKAHAPSHRFVHLRNGNLFGEARLFAGGTQLPLDHPHVYRAEPDYLHLDFLIVMEDLNLRGADPRDATRPMNVDQVASGLRGLARLHREYWNFDHTSHPHLRFVKDWTPSQGWQVGLRKRVPIGMQRGADLLPASIAGFSPDRIVDDWAAYVGKLTGGDVTLLHGDAHIGNTYALPGDEVGFLDWQVVRRGHWSQDVGYFLMGSLTEQDCRAHERELLALYRDALQLPDDLLPGEAAVWQAYRASAAYGLAIWLSTLGTDGWQKPEISRALVSRYAAAHVALECDKALAEGSI